MPKIISPTLPEASLMELNSRLKQTRWPPVVGSDDWQYGVPQAWLKDMVEYWIEEWDWNKQEVN